MGENPLRVGIVGSRKYENRKKIKDFIFKLKNEKGIDTIIVSGGAKYGADRYAKKYALELGLQYQEFPPFHENWNIHCPKNKSDYGKPYNIKNFYARNKINDNIKIIDLKTSTRSWSHFQKKDFYKTSQLILYKQFYADKFDVPLDKISVEFLILKRKVAKKSDWPISRLQRFEPANGSVTLNKGAKAFDEFRTLVFEEDGNYKTDREYPA